MNDSKTVLLAFGIFIMGAIVFAANKYSTRGTRLIGTQCAWDQSSGQYLASMTVRNTEALWKLVDYRIAMHLKPGQGQRWSHPDIKRAYETLSSREIFLLEPEKEWTQTAHFDVPDVEGFACTANVTPGWQERFAERPAESTLQALAQREQPGGMPASARRRF